MSSLDIARKLRSIASGNMETLEGPHISEVIAPRLRAQQIAALSHYTPAMMAANAINASILMVALFPHVNRVYATLWAFLLITLSMFVYIKRMIVRARPQPKSVSVRAVHHAIIYALALGILWACLPLLFFQNAEQSTQVIILTVSIGMLCGGAFVLAPVPIAGIAFIAPLVVTTAITFARTGETVYFLVVGLLVVYTFVLLRAMNSYATQFAVRFLSELENEKAALSDSLTRLPNRAAFEQSLNAALSRANRYGDQYALLYIDLDDFKSINDEYGHAGGDDFLIQVSERLQMCSRESDVVARISGDEFAIIATNVDSPEVASTVAERVLRAFEAPFKIQSATVPGSCSIGIALIPYDGGDVEDLKRKADSGLYSAKNRGKRTYCFYQSAHEALANTRKALEEDLKAALRNDEFHLVFQPLVNLKTGLTAGYEALLRWEQPVRGLISPAEFVSIAEKAGLIHEIGEWVIKKAIAAAADWPVHLRVAINVSPTQFRTMEVVSVVKDALMKSGISASRVELEITESAILSDVERAQIALAGLRALGVQISLDDFGTGFSSLTHLINLPITRVKIDRSFVQKMEADARSEALVRAMIMLAGQLKLGVTAEGVESEYQLLHLTHSGCEEAQGYYLSRPISENDLARAHHHCYIKLSAAA